MTPLSEWPSKLELKNIVLSTIPFPDALDRVEEPVARDDVATDDLRAGRVRDRPRGGCACGRAAEGDRILLVVNGYSIAYQRRLQLDGRWYSAADVDVEGGRRCDRKRRLPDLPATASASRRGPSQRCASERKNGSYDKEGDERYAFFFPNRTCVRHILIPPGHWAGPQPARRRAETTTSFSATSRTALPGLPCC